tara:strand:- start:619 stop:807 length:189 start_codon:yes stop_codon:yes gene_type:complete
MMNKNKSTFLNNCYEWLFSEEERRPIGYIAVFFLAMLISVFVALFIVAIDRHVEGWINYLWN